MEISNHYSSSLEDILHEVLVSAHFLYHLIITQMQNAIRKEVSNYQAEFEVRAGVLHITLKSFEKSIVLFARYSRDGMPAKLSNLIEEPEELYHVLLSLAQDKMRLSENNEIIIALEIFGLRKEYALPLESAPMPAEEVLGYQNCQLKKNILELKEQMQQKNEIVQTLKEEIQSLRDRVSFYQQKIAKMDEDNKKAITQLKFKNSINIKPSFSNIQAISAAKFNFNWDTSLKYGGYYTLLNNKVARKSTENWNYVQLTSTQEISRNQNYKISLKVNSYGSYGGIIFGLISSSRKILKYSGGKQAGDYEESIAYRTYEMKGEYKARIYQYGRYTQRLPFVNAGEIVEVIVDWAAEEVRWVKAKQGIVWISKMDASFKNKEIYFFICLYQSGDSVEIM